MESDGLVRRLGPPSCYADGVRPDPEVMAKLFPPISKKDKSQAKYEPGDIIQGGNPRYKVIGTRIVEKLKEHDYVEEMSTNKDLFIVTGFDESNRRYEMCSVKAPSARKIYANIDEVDKWKNFSKTGHADFDSDFDKEAYPIIIQYFIKFNLSKEKWVDFTSKGLEDFIKNLNSNKDKLLIKSKN